MNGTVFALLKLREKWLEGKDLWLPYLGSFPKIFCGRSLYCFKKWQMEKKANVIRKQAFLACYRSSSFHSQFFKVVFQKKIVLPEESGVVFLALIAVTVLSGTTTPKNFSKLLWSTAHAVPKWLCNLMLCIWHYSGKQEIQKNVIFLVEVKICTLRGISL